MEHATGPKPKTLYPYALFSISSDLHLHCYEYGCGSEDLGGVEVDEGTVGSDGWLVGADGRGESWVVMDEHGRL